MKLTRLEIHGYREVAPGTVLTFGPAHNLVLGDNGTGRTTLLELISQVLRADFSTMRHEPFSLAWRVELPGMTLDMVVRNLPATPDAVTVPVVTPRLALALPPSEPDTGLHPYLEADVRLSGPDTRLRVRADASGLGCEVDGVSVWSRGMHWSVLDRTVWTLLFMGAQYIDRGLRERLRELLRRTFLLSPSRFDEALGTFERIGTHRYAMESHGDDVFPLGLMALPTWLPGWLRRQVEREPPREALEFAHDELERNFLARFVELAGFASGTMRVEVLERRDYEDGGRLAFGRFSFRFTRRDGTTRSQEQLGHGQKRLLSFLYYLDVNEDFVIADELPNGLHPRHVATCVDELGARQAFLTSQNPLLLEHVTFRSAQDLRRSVIHCAVEQGPGPERLRWSQPDADVATRLFPPWCDAPHGRGALLRTHGLG
ncbi:AAA family ATPase [Myxococcaceae bacterium JPH2]|nr:AAA family ATPase [Myxococcaceae bacterium JPH2]